MNKSLEPIEVKLNEGCRVDHVGWVLTGKKGDWR